MRKVLFAALMGLGFSTALLGLPVLNPADPALLTEGVLKYDRSDFLGIKFGYRGDFVFNKCFNVEGTVIKQFSLFANEGVVALNIWDRVDIYAFFGAASFNTEANPQDPNLSTLFDAFTTQSLSRIIVGVGVKATIWEICWLTAGKTYIGIDAQYQGINKAPFAIATIQGANANTNGTKRSYREGQVSVGVAHKIHFFIPYLAIKWSNARANASGQVGDQGSVTPGTVLNLGDYRASHQWGIAVGVTLLDEKRASLSAEARFFDENALSVAANFRF